MAPTRSKNEEAVSNTAAVELLQEAISKGFDMELVANKKGKGESICVYIYIYMPLYAS